MALALIWGLAGAVIFLLHATAPTPESVIAFLRQQNVARQSALDRDKNIRGAADRLNRLTFEQMREVRKSGTFLAFYRPLSPPEKERFVELVMPTGLRRILDASQDLPPDQRAEFLKKTLYLATLDFSVPNPPLDPEALTRIEREALKSYTDGLSAEVKAQMQPQLQQIRAYLYPGKMTSP